MSSFAVGPHLEPMVTDLGLGGASVSLVSGLLLFGARFEAPGGYGAAFGLASALPLAASLLSARSTSRVR